MLDYKREYERWLASDALNADEKAELQAIAGDEKEISSVSKSGTAPARLRRSPYRR